VLRLTDRAQFEDEKFAIARRVARHPRRARSPETDVLLIRELQFAHRLPAPVWPSISHDSHRLDLFRLRPCSV